MLINELCISFRDIVRDTARLLRGIFRRDEYSEIVGIGVSGDISRLVDVVAEEYIVDRIGKTKYSAWVISEERGLRKMSSGKPDIIALIDPLDGSLNYSLGIPFASISIAIYRGLVEIINPIYGVVYNIFTDDAVEICNSRVYFNGENISSRFNKGLEVISIYTENPRHIEMIKEMFERHGIEIKTRTMGSASLEGVYAAIGLIGHFIHLTGTLRNIDIAVALAIARALDTNIYTDPPVEEMRIDDIQVFKKVFITSRESPLRSIFSEL